MLCREAVAQALEAFGPDARFVCANGYISREVALCADRPEHFYMLGSMGLAASIGLGAALAQPEQTIVVLDGDGNVLMGLGALAVIGARAPRRLYHLCLDNGVYASTGNQPSVAPQVSLEGIALAAGYARALRADDAVSLSAALRELAAGPGPAFLRVLIEPEAHPREFPRIAPTPEALRDRFRATLLA